ncbi:hypothetical protein [Paraglaciecola sp.]|uniref:hypothetical protein n=1 Tax=Paraglaciecola sp. TaxID=1920173 RepID=UPI0030F41A86
MKKLFLSTLFMFAVANVFAAGDAFSILDTDSDGLISREEAKVDDTLSAIFAELDINQDGYLSKLELEVKTGN